MDTQTNTITHTHNFPTSFPNNDWLNNVDKQKSPIFSFLLNFLCVCYVSHSKTKTNPNPNII